MTLLEQIRSGQREFALPALFTCNNTQYEILECLRFLPRKRAVFLVREVDQVTHFILKLFLPEASRDFEAELTGYQYLCNSQIKTPEQLMHGRFPEYLCVLYQYIDAASGVTADKGFEAAVSAVEQLHRAGLVQLDIHPDNFLLSPAGCWVIDCASIAKASEDQQRENMALFLAQFQWAAHKHLAEKSGRLGLLPEVREIWRRRIGKYLKKIFRDCTEIAVRKRFSEFVAFKREHTALAEDFLADIDAAMATGKVLKDGNSATVVRTTLAGRDVVIKRYNLKNWRHAINRLYRPSRAWNAWRAAHLLDACGIKTPVPILIKENRFGVLRRNAYLITEAIDGQELTDVYAGREPTVSEFSELKTLFNLLSEVGISHGDLKATNIMLNDDGLFLIDLDVLTEVKNIEKAALAHNIDKTRFLKNWESQPVLSQRFFSLFS